MPGDEKALIRRLLLGDQEAYRSLIADLEKPLLTFIERYVPKAAEDIFQETFVRVVRKLAEFKPNVSLKTWIFTIARNLCLDHIKAHRRRGELSLDAQAEEEEGRVITFKDVLAAAEGAPIEAAQKSEDQTQVRELLATLDPVRREVLVLRMYCDMPYEEIAKIVEAPVGTCKYRVHEALNHIAARMGQSRGEAAS